MDGDGAPEESGGQGATESFNRLWITVRAGLSVFEAGMWLTQHEALASAAGAVVAIGDVIFYRPRKS